MNSVSRRQVLGGFTGASVLSLTSFRSVIADDGFVELTARATRVRLKGSDGPESELIGYEGMVPGPTLRFTQGQIARIRFRNELDVPSTIHWHGIRLENAMDGVPGLTQDAVQPGGSFDYEFTPPDAGTFWYHAHVNSWNQVARGLFGALIIDEAKPAFAAEDDHVLVLTDWRLNADGVFDAGSLGNVKDWSGAGRIGNFLTVNGVRKPDVPVVAGTGQRLRLINTSTARILKLKLSGADFKIIARDGQALAEPQSESAFWLGPAQRADILVEFAPGAVVEMLEASLIDTLIARFVASNSAVARPTPVLAAPDLPVPDLTTIRWIPLKMTGGAEGNLESFKIATMSGDMQMQADTPTLWAFNNVAHMGDEPLFEVASGETVGLDMDNHSNQTHAIHVHGHDFREIPKEGATTQDDSWYDTALVYSFMRVAFVAGKPGKWMIHCHMLEHSAAGMDTWFRVV